MNVYKYIRDNGTRRKTCIVVNVPTSMNRESIHTLISSSEAETLSITILDK